MAEHCFDTYAGISHEERLTRERWAELRERADDGQVFKKALGVRLYWCLSSA